MAQEDIFPGPSIKRGIHSVLYLPSGQLCFCIYPILLPQQPLSSTQKRLLCLRLLGSMATSCCGVQALLYFRGHLVSEEPFVVVALRAYPTGSLSLPAFSLAWPAPSEITPCRPCEWEHDQLGCGAGVFLMLKRKPGGPLCLAGVHSRSRKRSFLDSSRRQQVGRSCAWSHWVLGPVFLRGWLPRGQGVGQ